MAPSAILSQYLSPTWKLIISAQPSALSRWLAKPAVKQLQFQLIRLDLEQPETDVLVFQGQQGQLEELCTVIQNYVQQLLTHNTYGVHVARTEPSVENTAAAEPPTRDVATEAVPHIDTNQASATDSRPAAPSPSTSLHTDDTKPAASDRVHLTPRNAFRHQLHLPAIAETRSATELNLSSVDLFDLSEVVAQWQQEMLTLPTLPTTQRRFQWHSVGQIAATVLMTAGLTTSGVYWWSRQAPNSMTATSGLAPAAEDRGQLEAAQPGPAAASNQALLDQLTPVPSTVLDLESALRASASIDGVTNGATAGNSTIAQFPNTSQNAPGNLGFGIPTVLPPPPPPADGITGLPSVPSTPLPQASTYEPRRGRALPAIPAAPPAPSPAAAASQASEFETATEADVDIAAARAELANELARTSEAQLPEVQQFGAAPSQQVAEIQAYFQSIWQPPESLNQTLQYQVAVNSDGTLRQVIPLDGSSGQFIDRTGIPLMGEVLSSPAASNQPFRVIVSFSPSGGVSVSPN
ncbi:MAG: DUF4335 domain-containing protein [Cyanobacteria bacterium P01_H01_bin.121]